MRGATPHRGRSVRGNSDEAGMAEAKVLQLLTEQNKPFNVQVVSDFLATHGVKKTACQKALDALAEQGTIVCKVRARMQSCRGRRGRLRPCSPHRMPCHLAASLVSAPLLRHPHAAPPGVWQDQNLHAQADRHRHPVQGGACAWEVGRPGGAPLLANARSTIGPRRALTASRARLCRLQEQDACKAQLRELQAQLQQELAAAKEAEAGALSLPGSPPPPRRAHMPNTIACIHTRPPARTPQSWLIGRAA